MSGMDELTRRDAALAEPLAVVRRTALRAIPATQAARVVRRIVDGEQVERLDVAAFNSAP